MSVKLAWCLNFIEFSCSFSATFWLLRNQVPYRFFSYAKCLTAEKDQNNKILSFIEKIQPGQTPNSILVQSRFLSLSFCHFFLNPLVVIKIVLSKVLSKARRDGLVAES